MAGMGLCSMVVLGGVAGWLASVVAGTNARMGLVANVLVGVLGSTVGGVVFRFFGGAGVTGFNLSSLLVSVVGACVVLVVAKKLFRF
ncbi:MAG: GlsB/YeaQ/YmgE family stress response membrane protein [Myxococcaceae bacterium]|nr:GlsB/YeaQ/YmgE family stress response membrane protein [Myxococcaceae bacterium]